MLLNIIVITFISLILYRIWILRLKRKKEKIRQSHLNQLNSISLAVEHLNLGGVFELSYFDEHYQKADFVVNGLYLYREENCAWLTWRCTSGEIEVWLEYEKGEDKPLIVNHQKISLEQLGLEIKDFQRMYREEKGSINYREDLFEYEDSDEAIFYNLLEGEEIKIEKLNQINQLKHYINTQTINQTKLDKILNEIIDFRPNNYKQANKFSERLEYLLFYNKNREKFISIEKWGINNFEIRIGNRMDDCNINIFNNFKLLE